MTEVGDIASCWADAPLLLHSQRSWNMQASQCRACQCRGGSALLIAQLSAGIAGGSAHLLLRRLQGVPTLTELQVHGCLGLALGGQHKSTCTGGLALGGQHKSTCRGGLALGGQHKCTCAGAWMDSSMDGQPGSALHGPGTAVSGQRQRLVPPPASSQPRPTPPSPQLASYQARSTRPCC
jgi:hypothetical protein